MTVSLDGFLRAGIFGDLRRGMSQDEVRALLGEPDATGGASRKYPRPCIFLYGTVELWFGQAPPRGLTGVWWEPGEKGAFRLTPATRIADWAFTPDWTFGQVVDHLRQRGLTFVTRDAPSPGCPPCLVLASGVEVFFGESGRLYGLSG
jgi:hypothetical protein